MPTIVQIEGTDLKELAALSQELCDRETNMSCLKDTIAKMIDNPDYILIGVRDDRHQLIGSVMGIICMDIVGDCRPFLVLENLIVSEKARGLGIGKMLVKYIEERARERNCYYIMFTSLTKRKEAHRFYESIGYAKGVAEGFKKYL